MRVLIVSHHALPHVGGVETMVDLEVRGLVKAGHSVVQVTSDAGGDSLVRPPVSRPTGAACPATANDGNKEWPVRVVRVPTWGILERRFHLAYPIFSPRLIPILWREIGLCDVLHAHGYIFMPSFLALVIGWLRGKPRLLTDHGGIQRYHSWVATYLAWVAAHTIGCLSARLATRLITFNSRITRLLERLAGTKSKTQFLPNPVDYAMFHPPTSAQRQAARKLLGWPPDRPKVLFVGRFIPDKGIGILLEALDPAYDIVFCGSGDPSLLGKLPRPGVEYLPPRPKAELVTVYHAADLLALPSQREGFPLVVQEALACGLKVVMSYDEGYEPYRHLPGLRFCARQPHLFRQAMLELLREPEPRIDSSALRQMCPPIEEWVERLYGSVEKQLQLPKSAKSTLASK